MAEFDTVAPESLRLRRPLNPVDATGESGVTIAPIDDRQMPAVARMLQREGAPEEEEEIQAKHDPSAQGATLAQREGEEEEEVIGQARRCCPA